MLLARCYRAVPVLCLALVCLQANRLFSQEVTLKREAISLTDPRTFSIPLRTTAIRQLDLVAPVDGIVRQVQVKSNAKVMAQAEVCRMDDEVQRLKVERAKAYVDAAEAELKAASAKGEMDLQTAAHARLDAARAEFKLAELELAHLGVKAPFAGEVFRVLVSPGQYVRAGEKLMTIADTSAVLIEIPVDRSEVKQGSEVELSIEKTAVKAKVQAILSPEPQFEPLRTMVHQLSTAVVEVDNSKGDFFVGQSVFVKSIPQQTFGHIATAALQNTAEGGRKVQILRQGTVRDLPVDVLTQMGPDRLFVAGAFQPDDEIIINSSQPLKDGQILRPRALASAPVTPGAEVNPNTVGPAKPTTPATTTKPTTPGF